MDDTIFLSNFEKEQLERWILFQAISYFKEHSDWCRHLYQKKTRFKSWSQSDKRSKIQFDTLENSDGMEILRKWK